MNIEPILKEGNMKEEQLDIFINQNGVLLLGEQALSQLHRINFSLINKNDAELWGKVYENINVSINKFKQPEYAGALLTAAMVVELLENLFK